MPVELLRELAQLQLPVTVTKLEDIYKTRVLLASGATVCSISDWDADEQFARISDLTPDGRSALALDALVERRKLV